MTDTPSGRPRRRRHRRASRGATTGHPDAGHWTKDAPPVEPTDDADPEAESGQRRVAGRDGGPESSQDRWWREQRPPHYE